MRKLSFILIYFLLFSCSKNENTNQNLQSDWLVDEADISGALSLYPLVLNPEFMSISNSNLEDNTMVGVVTFGSEIRVYPYTYMSAVEIVNDEYNGQKFALSYCPITKSSIAFTREQTFRVSGYLYKDNLAPWDEKTESIWSQMLLKGIRGSNKNRMLNTIPVLETALGTIRQYYPNAKILVTDSETNRDSSPPDDNDIENDNVPNIVELAYGIFDSSVDNVNIFRFSDFNNSNIIKVTIQSQEYIVYGNSSKHVFNAFKVSNSDNYQSIEGEFPYVFKNINGVKYDILGRGTNGTVLEKPKYAYVAIWRAWDDFYDNFVFQ